MWWMWMLGRCVDRARRRVRGQPADKGGATCFGITQEVARAQGYTGPMRQLPRSEAVNIYLRLCWLRPRLGEVAKRSAHLAAELFDTGVNMGPAVAVTFLQRALTALSRGGTDYPDLTPDGIALIKYSFAVPANRIGYAHGSTGGQLKITQEVTTLAVFAVFAAVVLKEPIGWRYLGAFACLAGAAAFMFARKA